MSAMRMSAVVAFPCYVFVLVAAPEIVRVLFGEKWAASIPVLRILCLFGALHAVMSFNGSLLQSIGRARLVFRIMVIDSTLQVIAFAVAVPYGIRWVAASYVIRAYLMAPVSLTIAARALETTVRATLTGLVAPLVSSGAMAAATLAAAVGLAGAPAGLRLLALAVAATAVYLGALRLIGRDAFDEAAGYVRAVAGGRRPRTAGSAV